jgi:hypothetical protein
VIGSFHFTVGYFTALSVYKLYGVEWERNLEGSGRRLIKYYYNICFEGLGDTKLNQ